MEGKYSINSVIKVISIILSVTIAVYCVWYFRFLVFCIFFALILSIIGQPIMNLLGKIKINSYTPSSTSRAAITLTAELAVITLIIYSFAPIILTQSQNIAAIDVTTLEKSYSAQLKIVNDFIVSYNLLPDSMTIEEFCVKQVMNTLNTIKLPQIATRVFALVGKITASILIISFITFFFLKDAHIVTKFINSVTPDKYLNAVNNIIVTSRKLISRYFIGIFCEIVIMITLLSIGFSLANFSNAILIACICGIMVILPYIGVIIGGGIGLIILLTGTIAVTPDANLVMIAVSYVAIFAVTKIIDDVLLQPLIYSKSVKAKPLEIFLVILMAGEIGGIIGMILAIPVYTFVRIIAKTFFSKWKFIKNLTKSID